MFGGPYRIHFTEIFSNTYLGISKQYCWWWWCCCKWRVESHSTIIPKIMISMIFDNTNNEQLNEQYSDLSQTFYHSIRYLVNPSRHCSRKIKYTLVIPTRKVHTQLIPSTSRYILTEQHRDGYTYWLKKLKINIVTCGSSNYECYDISKCKSIFLVDTS